MVVKVYSTSWCAYCHVLMDWLDSLGVKYEEIDAESVKDIQSVPVTEIGETRVIGLDRPAILKALKKEGLVK
ncbi:MAG: glutaredoxin family protein [Bacteroidales bacterium]|nr:glutaredoxin family protein [Candidatus Saccharibacteria bacterium]MBR6417191.1 glutaredoxin family protein [Bacteroidales bacterium]